MLSVITLTWSHSSRFMWRRTLALHLTWFYTNRNCESDPNWDHEKSEVKGPGDMTPPKIQITSRELIFWGVLVYSYLSQCRVFFKKIRHIFTCCSLNPNLIQVVTSLTQSLLITLYHKFCPICLVPHIKLISFPLNSSFCTNPAQTCGVEILTGLTWELCVERGLQALSQLHSLATLFPFCHFHFHLSAHVHNWKPDSRPRSSQVCFSSPRSGRNRSRIAN
jgi:hypothetical protein